MRYVVTDWVIDRLIDVHCGLEDAVHLHLFPIKMRSILAGSEKFQLCCVAFLLQVGCSPHMQFFLCSLYAPACTLLETPMPPCRSFCERVVNDCEALLNAFALQWPDSVNCDRFPSSGLCVGLTE